jgi:hypothetical protein
MADKYSSNPTDDLKEIFAKLEPQVSNISHNMVILMSVLERKFKPFKELGSSISMLARIEPKD